MLSVTGAGPSAGSAQRGGQRVERGDPNSRISLVDQQWQQAGFQIEAAPQPGRLQFRTEPVEQPGTQKAEAFENEAQPAIAGRPLALAALGQGVVAQPAAERPAVAGQLPAAGAELTREFEQVVLAFAFGDSLSVALAVLGLPPAQLLEAGALSLQVVSQKDP